MKPEKKLKATLEAIRARIKGDWDHPALMKFGALGNADDDILLMIEIALKKEGK